MSRNGFCPSGALAVPRGDEIVPLSNHLPRRLRHVILTQDWYPDGHLSFASPHFGRQAFDTIELIYGLQMLWPDHCIRRSKGAEFRPSLGVPHAEVILRKGYHRTFDSYLAYFENDRAIPTELGGYLRERGLARTYSCRPRACATRPRMHTAMT